MAPTKDEGVEKKDPAQTKEEIILELPKETTERSKGYHPPPSTRHRGVLALARSVPLFDFGSRIGEPTLQALIDETKNAEPLFNVNSISTGDQCNNLMEHDLVEISVRFYGMKAADIVAATNGKPAMMMKEIRLVMPKVWTPKMYLRAVNISIERSKSILIEAIVFRGQRYITINDVHWLFTEENLSNPSSVSDRLISMAA